MQTTPLHNIFNITPSSIEVRDIYSIVFTVINSVNFPFLFLFISYLLFSRLLFATVAMSYRTPQSSPLNEDFSILSKHINISSKYIYKLIESISQQDFQFMRETEVKLNANDKRGKHRTFKTYTEQKGVEVEKRSNLG